MDTRKYTGEIFRFIVLTPHRDALNQLYEYRKKLFSAGFSGAYSFPATAPLALVSSAFSPHELKELARKLRLLTLKSDGKIQSNGTTFAPCPDGFGLSIPACEKKPAEQVLFFGPRLNLTPDAPGDTLFPETTRKKILFTFSPPILCAALVGSESIKGLQEPPHYTTPAFSFRAAALANLSIRLLGEGENPCSFEWKMSPPIWLPVFKKEEPKR